jgi:hypothetical protein
MFRFSTPIHAFASGYKGLISKLPNLIFLHLYSCCFGDFSAFSFLKRLHLNTLEVKYSSVGTCFELLSIMIGFHCMQIIQYHCFRAEEHRLNVFKAPGTHHATKDGFI